MPDMQNSLILYSSRIKKAKLFGIGLILVLTILGILHASFATWFWIALIALAFSKPIYNVIKPFRLQLSDKGFETTSVFHKKEFISWDDVIGFKLVSIPMRNNDVRKFVAFGYVAADNKHGRTGRVFIDNYGKTAEELVELLNEWKSKYSKIDQAALDLFSLQTETQNKLPTSELVGTSRLMGILSFIPLIGLLFGILAIIFGIVAKRDINKGLYSSKDNTANGIVLGSFGILLTVVLYGSMYYFDFIAKKGPFEQGKNDVTTQVLTQDAGLLELYKNKTGKYPASLEDLKTAGYQVYPSDYWMNPLYYRISADRLSYELRSLGTDGTYGTGDDIFPKK